MQPMLRELMYKARYFSAFALILAAATSALYSGKLDGVTYSGLVGGCFLTLCGGGVANSRKAVAKIHKTTEGEGQ